MKAKLLVISIFLAIASHKALAEKVIVDQSEKAGKKLFVEKGCFSCHGADGLTPIHTSFPKLGGQNANYLAQQIKSILAGERTTELAKLMVKSSPPLTQEDIEKISQYLESVKKADSFQNM